MSKPRNMSMKMLESVDVIKLSNEFTLDMIAHVFRCSTQYVRNCIMRQEIEEKTKKEEMNVIKRGGSGAWKELKETALYQQIMNK